MIINKKAVKSNKLLKEVQHEDKKQNRDKKLEKGCVLKRNIGKVVSLSSQVAIGNDNDKKSSFLPDYSCKEFLEMIKASGLTGMSGNGFPVYEKLNTYMSAPLTSKKTIIVNGAECEIGLVHDKWLMENKLDEVMFGVKCLQKALNPDRVIVATRGKSVYSSQEKGDNVTFKRVPLKYPLGEEHFLISQILGINIDRATIPAKSGILVINVQTVYQIGRIVSGTYDGGHFVTLANMTNGKGRIGYVNNDSNIIDVMKNALGNSELEVYAGNGVGNAEKCDGEQNFSNTTFFAAYCPTPKISNHNKCKRCGGCTKKCPMGVDVRSIVLAKEKDSCSDISKWGGDKCIHCGTCTYFCMASKDPASYMTK